MLGVIEGIVAAARRNPARPAVITGNRSVVYGDLVEAIARISNHLVQRGLPPRSKLFLNIGDPDLRLIVTIAAMHAGFIPFVLLAIGDLADQVDYDFVVGAAVPNLPDLPADLTIDQSVLSGKLSDGTLREFPEQPDDAILLISATSGSTGRPKLVAESYGASRLRSRLRGLVPGEGEIAPPVWYQQTRDDRLILPH